MSDTTRQIGARLRALRHARGWTLDDLASSVNMSASTLSRLESGQRQASLELIVPLARELGVRIDDLVEPVAADPRVRRTVIHRDGMVIAPLTPEGSPVATYKITFSPRTHPPELRVHQGYEWLYVLSGKLRLLLGNQNLVLGKGEAAEFDTTVPHCMFATGSRPAQVLSIFNQDGARMHIHTADREEGPPVD